MFGNQQNPFGQPLKNTVLKTEQFQTASGQYTEVKWLQKTVLINTDREELELFTVEPPLADGRIPNSIADIRQCGVCEQLFHQDSVFPPCDICGDHYCSRCRDVIKIEGEEIQICANCANEINKGMFSKIQDWFFMKDK